MKKSIKLFVSLILVLSILTAAATTFFAETIFTSNGYSYTLMDNTYISLYDWDGGSDTLTIPNSLDYLYVREIRNRCFIGRDDFITLNLGEADYLNRIGLSAFKNTAITGTLHIPPQVRTVASGAFENCDNIEVLYYDSMSELVSAQCFYDCDALREVYLTEGVTTIEPNAFSSCESLQIIVIPDTVTKISDSAFSGCDSLVIYCYTDSAAHQFAESNGIEYVLIDAPEPTEPPTELPTQEPTVVPTEAPTTEPTQLPTEISGYYLGDVNGDDVVDSIDTTIIQRYLASIPYTTNCDISHGDVNNDGITDTIDVSYIMRYLANIDDVYTIGEWVVQHEIHQY